MIPTDKRFCTRKFRLITLNIILGLIVNLEFPLLERARKVVEQAMAQLLPDTHLLIVDHEVSFRRAHGAAGRSGPVKQAHRLYPLLPGGNAHAKADIGMGELPAQPILKALQQRVVIVLGRAVDIKTVSLKAPADSLRLGQEAPDLLTEGLEHPVAIVPPVKLVDGVKLFDVHDDRVGLAHRIALIQAACVLKEEISVIEPGQGVRLDGGDQLPLLILPPLRPDDAQKQRDDEQRHHRHDDGHTARVVPQEAAEGDALAEIGIGGQGGLHQRRRGETADFVQDGIEAVIVPPDGKGKVRLPAACEGGEMVSLAHVLHAVEPVAVYQHAVRLARGDGLEAVLPFVIIADLPVGEIVLQEGLKVQIAACESYRHGLVRGDSLSVGGARRRVELCRHIGVCDDNAKLFPVIGAEIHREQAVDFPALQRLHALLRGGITPGLKAQHRVFLAGLRKVQDI